MNITTYIEPNSSSPSIICRGTYNDKPAYFKISLINKGITQSSEQGLSYEAEIYKKINSYKNNEHVKNIDAFFLNYFDPFSLNVTAFLAVRFAYYKYDLLIINHLTN